MGHSRNIAASSVALVASALAHLFHGSLRLLQTAQ